MFLHNILEEYPDGVNIFILKLIVDCKSYFFCLYTFERNQFIPVIYNCVPHYFVQLRLIHDKTGSLMTSSAKVRRYNEIVSCKCSSVVTNVS